MKQIGERIGALLSMDETEAYLLGYGVYDGLHDSPFGCPNPRITLDDGTVVWGAQCWWGSEAGIRKKIEGLKVTLVDIEGNPK